MPQQRRGGDQTGKDDEPREIPGIVRRHEDDKRTSEEGGAEDLAVRAAPPDEDPSGERCQETGGGRDVGDVGDSAERKERPGDAPQEEPAARNKAFFGQIARQEAE